MTRPFIIPPANDLGERLRDDAPVHLEIVGEAEETFLDRVREAFSDPLFTFYCGGYVGALATVSIAYVWSLWL